MRRRRVKEASVNDFGTSRADAKAYSWSALDGQDRKPCASNRPCDSEADNAGPCYDHVKVRSVHFLSSISKSLVLIRLSRVQRQRCDRVAYPSRTFTRWNTPASPGAT